MTDNITFTGQSSMKGVNGYTELGSAETFSSGGSSRYVCFYSPRARSGVGTALLELNRADFEAFKAWVAGMQFDDERTEREIEIGSIAFTAEQAEGSKESACDKMSHEVTKCHTVS
jgi:hypothetical protein